MTGPPILIAILATAGIAAGLSDAATGAVSQLASLRVQLQRAEAEAEGRDRRLLQQAHEIQQLKLQNKQLRAQIKSSSEAHEGKSRALLYSVEKLRPRAEFAEAAQAEVFELRAENETRAAEMARLAAQMHKKSKQLHSTNRTMQRLQDELREVRGLSEERGRMYSELSDAKAKTEEQLRAQLWKKDKELREVRLFRMPNTDREECRTLLQELRSIDDASGNLVAPHESTSPTEIGWKSKFTTNFVKTYKKELAKERLKGSGALRATLGGMAAAGGPGAPEPGREGGGGGPAQGKRKPPKKSGKHSAPANPHLTAVTESGSAKGARLVEFAKVNNGGAKKLAGIDAKKPKKGGNAASNPHKELLKGEKRAQQARESLASKPKKDERDEGIKKLQGEMLKGGLSWLSSQLAKKPPNATAAAKTAA